MKDEHSFNKKLVIASVGVVALGISIIVVLVLFPSILPSFRIDSSSSTTLSNSSPPQGQEAKSIVPIDQIVFSVQRDAIPSINNPDFVSVFEADRFLDDSDLIVGVNIRGDIRAYPIQILLWHEIVNDNVGNTPIAITYCPLCFTSQIFNRTLDNETVIEFGNSGKLYNSNLVLYDKQTSSLWSQALGQSIQGELSGTKLERIPFDVVKWSDWKNLYLESKVLSRDTGVSRPYGADPYRDYFVNDVVAFPVSNQDDRLGLKEIIIGLDNEDQYKAYKLQDIEDKKIINDQIGNKSISLFSAIPFMARAFDPIVDGQALQFEYNAQNNNFVDIQTGSEWNFEGVATSGALEGKQLNRLPLDEGFWFEWVAFHPGTELYTA